MATYTDDLNAIESCTDVNFKKSIARSLGSDSFKSPLKKALAANEKDVAAYICKQAVNHYLHSGSLTSQREKAPLFAQQYADITDDAVLLDIVAGRQPHSYSSDQITAAKELRGLLVFQGRKERVNYLLSKLNDKRFSVKSATDETQKLVFSMDGVEAKAVLESIAEGKHYSVPYSALLVEQKDSDFKNDAFEQVLNVIASKNWYKANQAYLHEFPRDATLLVILGQSASYSFNNTSNGTCIYVMNDVIYAAKYESSNFVKKRLMAHRACPGMGDFISANSKLISMLRDDPLYSMRILREEFLPKYVQWAISDERLAMEKEKKRKENEEKEKQIKIEQAEKERTGKMIEASEKLLPLEPNEMLLAKWQASGKQMQYSVLMRKEKPEQGDYLGIKSTEYDFSTGLFKLPVITKNVWNYDSKWSVGKLAYEFIESREDLRKLLAAAEGNVLDTWKAYCEPKYFLFAVEKHEAEEEEKRRKEDEQLKLGEEQKKVAERLKQAIERFGNLSEFPISADTALLFCRLYHYMPDDKRSEVDAGIETFIIMGSKEDITAFMRHITSVAQHGEAWEILIRSLELVADLGKAELTVGMLASAAEAAGTGSTATEKELILMGVFEKLVKKNRVQGYFAGEQELLSKKPDELTMGEAALLRMIQSSPKLLQLDKKPFPKVKELQSGTIGIPVKQVLK